MNMEEIRVSGETVYDGRIFTAKRDVVRLCDGSTSVREIVEHVGGVGILPIDEDGNIYLVRQFRYAIGGEILEIPAGKIDPGEEPYTCAVRELSEETGFTADKVEYLGEFFPSPGFCREKLSIYIATSLHRGEQHLDEGEFLDVVKMPLDEAYKMIMDNELLDGKSVIAILKARALRGR